MLSKHKPKDSYVPVGKGSKEYRDAKPKGYTRAEILAEMHPNRPGANPIFEEKEIIEAGVKKTITKYYKKQPHPDKPVESLMIVPYISTKTFPDYIRMMIEGYDWMPQMVHYVMNNVKDPLYKNKFDWKCVETFKKVKPTKYFIHHASDMYLNPGDLGRFKTYLDNDPKAFACGIYPIGNSMRHTKLFEDFTVPTRIVMWRASAFKKYMEGGIKMAEKLFNGVPLDCVFFMGHLAGKDGMHCIIDPKARPFTVPKDEFKTLWINPDNNPLAPEN